MVRGTIKHRTLKTFTNGREWSKLFITLSTERGEIEVVMMCDSHTPPKDIVPAKGAMVEFPVYVHTYSDRSGHTHVQLTIDTNRGEEF